MVVKYKGGVPTTPTTVKDNKGAVVGGGAVDFVVDSGAGQSMVNAATIKGGSFTIGGIEIGMGAGGPIGTLKITGGSMTFNATNPGDGKEVAVTCNKPMAIGAANLLGNDQLKSVKATFTNDPEELTGEIKLKKPV